MMYVSQFIMLYTLNLYIAVCQLYLNKTGREKETESGHQARQRWFFGYQRDHKQLTAI